MDVRAHYKHLMNGYEHFAYLMTIFAGQQNAFCWRVERYFKYLQIYNR